MQINKCKQLKNISASEALIGYFDTLIKLHMIANL